LYVDCTLGGGGHTRAILERGGLVVGLDQDEDAIAHTSSQLQSYIDDNKFEIIKSNFRHMHNVIKHKSKLAAASNGFVDGILMDLGVSSHQINEASRGFAFGADGPLDMRMGRSSDLKATNIINSMEVNDLADILYKYGEEQKSRQIAREIVSARPLNSTQELAAAISRITSFKERPKTLARCFQAIRIHVNDEVGALDDALSSAHELLRPGGRLVVMSYHSLEDRLVKNLFFRQASSAQSTSTAGGTTQSAAGIASQSAAGSTTQSAVVANPMLNPWIPLFKRAVTPSEQEIESNRRSRSAKLRAAERRADGDETLNRFAKARKYQGSFIGKKQSRKFSESE